MGGGKRGAERAAWRSRRFSGRESKKQQRLNDPHPHPTPRHTTQPTAPSPLSSRASCGSTQTCRRPSATPPSRATRGRSATAGSGTMAARTAANASSTVPTISPCKWSSASPTPPAAAAVTGPCVWSLVLSARQRTTPRRGTARKRLPNTSTCSPPTPTSGRRRSGWRSSGTSATRVGGEGADQGRRGASRSACRRYPRACAARRGSAAGSAKRVCCSRKAPRTRTSVEEGGRCASCPE
jgi:hypothetical protein